MVERRVGLIVVKTMAWNANYGSRMDAIRYDILRHHGQWLLTDGRSTPRSFLTSAEALRTAKSETDKRQSPSEVYMWRSEQSERVYSTLGLLDA